MQERDMAERNKILEIVTGSQLYGTNMPTSDKDYFGLFIADEEYYFGLNSVQEVDLSIIDKLENGKNSIHAVDRKFFELRKFVKLCIDNNPSVIESLFVNKENTIFLNYVGEELLRNRHLFPWKGLKDRFIGYSTSQYRKIIIKRDHMKDLETGLEQLKFIGRQNLISKFMFEIEDILFSGKVFSDNGNHHYKVGDIYIQKNVTIKKAIEQLETRCGKFGNRKELVDSYGYDSKFAGHCIRLLLEGKELLDTGEIQFPLKDREFLLDIRNGKYSLADIDKFIVEFQDEVRSSYENTKLPSKPRFDEVNKLLIRLVKSYLA